VKHYHDGFQDHLEPLRSLDLDRCASLDEVVRQMGQTAFAGRALGEAADVYECRVRDPDCFVIATVSGAMTVAKMGRLLHRRDLGPSILRSAFQKEVPVYVPAFTDSELGLDFLIVNEWRRQEGMQGRRTDPAPGTASPS
jgi:deoxyhypusine synthase